VRTERFKGGFENYVDIRWKVAAWIFTVFTSLIIFVPSAKISANPIPVPSILMPEEYIDIEFTSIGGVIRAKVDGAYPFGNTGYGTVDMYYPVPPDSENVSVELDDEPLNWSYSQWTYPTIVGDWPMIQWIIYPAPQNFVIKTHYEHAVPALDNVYTLVYAMGTGKYLDYYSKQTTAYVTVRIGFAYENLKVYADNEPIDNYEITIKNGATILTLTRTSEQFQPLLEDLIITLDPLKSNPGGEQANSVENLLPTDDSHVTENQPNTVADSGQRYNMYVGWDEQVYLSERIYLKFDLSGIPGGSIIDSAVLKIYNKYSPSTGEPPYPSKTMIIEARSVSDDNWLESTITWNNAPPMEPTVLDSKTINRGFGDPPATPELWEWWSFDVTSYVASEFAGDKIVSIGLISQNEGTDDATVWFYSKDAFEDQPRVYLRVSYFGAPLIVSISPRKNTGNPGETLEYVVRVTNGTGAQDTFDLTVDSEWEASLPSSVGPVPDNSSANVTLTVTIPEIYGGEDEITVTATSRTDPNVSDNDSCTASSFPIYPSDDAYVIEDRPDQNTGSWGDVVVGTVIYHDNWENRRGYLKFDLGEKIPSGARIDNAYLSIFTHYGGENGYPYGDATLTVDAKRVEDDGWTENMITWNNAPPMGAFLDGQLIPPTNDQRYKFDVTSHVASDIIGGDRVISIGLVSEEQGQNKFVPFTAKESEYWEGQESYLILYYTVPTPLVSVSISPDNQDGEPGGTLTYTVTVTNNGDITDTYDLSASDTEVWGLSLSQDTVTLDSGENGSIILTVSIPGTAEMGTEDTVTVTATSQADPDVRDWDTCIARASLRVLVSISPDEGTGSPGDTVTFTVTVRNAGTATDTFSLQATDTAGWSPTVSPSTLTLNAGASGTATVTVTIPSGADVGASTTITVTASGTGYDDSTTCTAIMAEEEGLPMILIAIVVVVVIVVIIALMLLRVRRAAPTWTS